MRNFQVLSRTYHWSERLCWLTSEAAAAKKQSPTEKQSGRCVCLLLTARIDGSSASLIYALNDFFFILITPTTLLACTVNGEGQ